MASDYMIYPNYAWGLRKEGKKNLVCILKGHKLCGNSCQRQGCNDTDWAHCRRCEASIVSSVDDPKLPEAVIERKI